MTSKIDAPKISNFISGLINLTKPRIISLLLITAMAGMYLASQGSAPNSKIILFVLLGGALAAGGANSINNYLDRDIDLLMERTKIRPLAKGSIPPLVGLYFGIALNICSFLMLYFQVNLLSACLTISATLFYVFIYTMWLKRRTPQNIVIGGAAGAIPPLVGWAAITNEIGIPAIALFLIIFFWTPPHFWALSILLKDDYAKAKIPMLPVVSSIQETAKQIVRYSVFLVLITIIFSFHDSVSYIYLGSSILLGGIFIYLSIMFKAESTESRAKKLYIFSLLYLALLFLSIILDGFFA
jgi:protoheme IX farnesyltransferase